MLMFSLGHSYSIISGHHQRILGHSYSKRLPFSPYIFNLISYILRSNHHDLNSPSTDAQTENLLYLWSFVSCR